jgi:CBS domain-containing protein
MSAWLAEDIMNPDVLTVRRGMTVRELATFLAENDISGVPVLDERERLVGVVSVTDIASLDRPPVDSGGPHHYYLRTFETKLGLGELQDLGLDAHDLLVGDIMTPAVFTVDPDTPVSSIAQTMLDEHIHRVMVTRGHRVLGIISSLDLLRILADSESPENVSKPAAPGPRRRGGAR